MLWNYKKNKEVAEVESVTFDCLSLANAGITKFVIQIYPFLYT